MRRIFLALLPAALFAQAQPVPQTTAKPGWKWTMDSVNTVVNAVRAGRSLQPAAWPNGARVAVLLSFDVDNETIGIRYGEPTVGALSQQQYGARVGLPRIVNLLDEHRIPATFFAPSVSLALTPSMIPLIKKSGRHEFSIHGWIHELNTTLPDSAERALLKKAMAEVTQLTGTTPTGYRAPSWNFSPNTLSILRDMGFRWESSLMADDRPYELLQDGKPTGLVELPVEWILDDAPLFDPRGQSYMNPRNVAMVWMDEFDKAYDEGTMFILTLHPHISGHRSRIVALEQLIAHIEAKGAGKVWWATHGDAADYGVAAKSEPRPPMNLSADNPPPQNARCNPQLDPLPRCPHEDPAVRHARPDDGHRAAGGAASRPVHCTLDGRHRPPHDQARLHRGPREEARRHVRWHDLHPAAERRQRSAAQRRRPNRLGALRHLRRSRDADFRRRPRRRWPERQGLLRPGRRDLHVHHDSRRRPRRARPAGAGRIRSLGGLGARRVGRGRPSAGITVDGQTVISRTRPATGEIAGHAADVFRDRLRRRRSRPAMGALRQARDRRCAPIPVPHARRRGNAAHLRDPSPIAADCRANDLWYNNPSRPASSWSAPAICRPTSDLRETFQYNNPCSHRRLPMAPSTARPEDGRAARAESARRSGLTSQEVGA